MIEDSFPPNFRRLAFTSVLNMMIALIPADIIIREQKVIITKQVFQSRIQMIAAISCFFKTPEALNSRFMKYIDTLFVSILNAHTHPLLHAAVIRAISEFPRININRWRVETHYREILKTLISTNYLVGNGDPKRKKDTSNFFKKMVLIFSDYHVAVQSLGSMVSETK